MRVAIIYYRHCTNFEIRDLLLRVPNTQVATFLLLDNKLTTLDGSHVTPHEIVFVSDAYILDPKIPHKIKENLHHYLDIFAVTYLYGKMDEQKSVPHTFLRSKTLEIKATHDDIEQSLATLWTTIAHPVRIKKGERISRDISSIHELRRQTLPHLLQGEHMECIYQPKGRKLICTLVRNARGKKVYATPLFEKISHTFSDKLSSASLSHNDKEKIIKRLEDLFAHYPTIPTLHVELTHTPKGIYLMHAAPIQSLRNECLPETLHAVGMQSSEVLASCFASLSTK